MCLCTHSGEPVIQADWVRAGAHVTSVGYREPHGEFPRDLLERGRLFVETRLAFEATPTGCYELQGVNPATGTELGEVEYDLTRERWLQQRDSDPPCDAERTSAYVPD